MNKTIFTTLVIILFSSCQVSKQYLVKTGRWSLETENDFSVIMDTTSNEKYYYNAIALNKYVYGEIPIELFSLPKFNMQYETKSDFNKKDLDELTKSVLKSVEFNIETDTLYFIVRGNILVYSSPDIDKNKITNAISLKGESPWTITDPPIRSFYYEDDMAVWDDDDIYRIFYYYPHRKQYLIKDCFRTGDKYLNFVYIFQSLTRENKHTTPREWVAMWDVTSPQRIFHTINLFKKANAISVKNKILTYND